MAYAEAICVHFLHKIEAGEYHRLGRLLLMTDAQTEANARARHPEIQWDEDRVQVRRDKAKFIRRLGADNVEPWVELLREEIRRDKKLGQPDGYPSEYRVTGLLSLPGIATLASGGSDHAEPAQDVA